MRNACLPRDASIAPSAPTDKILIVAGGGDYPGNPIIEQTKYLAGYALRLSLGRREFVALLPLLQARGFVPGGENPGSALWLLTVLYALVPCALKLVAIVLLAAIKIPEA